MDDIKQHLTHIKNGVKISYLLLLEKLNDINYNTRYSKKNLDFGASGAGLCHLKHYFKHIKAERKENSFDSMCKMRLGTLVHEDIQNALQYIYDDYKVMCEIPVEYDLDGMKVKGHLDVAIEIDDNNVMLIDIKTMAAYTWKMKFGRDIEKDASIWNKMQLATYSLGLKQDYGYENVHMYLLNYNKNTSAMKFEAVNVGFFENAANTYWHEVEVMVHQLVEDPLRIEQLIDGPVHKWECGYCDYSDICPVKYVKEK